MRSRSSIEDEIKQVKNDLKWTIEKIRKLRLKCPELDKEEKQVTGTNSAEYWEESKVALEKRLKKLNGFLFNLDARSAVLVYAKRMKRVYQLAQSHNRRLLELDALQKEILETIEDASIPSMYMETSYAQECEFVRPKLPRMDIEKLLIPLPKSRQVSRRIETKKCPECGKVFPMNFIGRGKKYCSTVCTQEVAARKFKERLKKYNKGEVV